MSTPKSTPKKGRPLTRESLIADGFVEGVDFYINHSGIALSLKPNKDRRCEQCGQKKAKFYSALHKTCRTCQRRMRDGIALDSPEARVRDIQYDGDRAVSAKEAQQRAAASVAAHQRELAARILAKRRLVHFIKRFHPGYKDGWVHRDICRRLERFMENVAAGKSPRLLLFCPPRLGKSLIASQYFPAWALGHHPDWEFISASYNVTLPIGFSRRIRETLRDPTYMSLFGQTRLSDESQAVEAWRTTSGGGYITAGVGTGITGKGCHILIIDDPIKDWEAASSQLIRESAWDWYLSTAYTRIAPGGGVLGIQTRWHDDDWAGRVILAMDSGEGEQFEVVSYPAINEEGDEYLLPDDNIVQMPPGMPPPEGAQLLRPMGSALHPDRYDIEALLRIKKNFVASGNVRMWSALYQQNPTPDEGAFFTKDMFRYSPSVPDPKLCHVYQAWDFSITEKESSDWIVGTCLAQDEYDNVYELDVLRFKSDENAFTIADAILDFHEKWKPWIIGVEDGQIWKSIKAVVARRAQERGLTPNFETLTPFTDKQVRAGPLRGRMQLGRLFFRKDAPWRTIVDQELLRFPAGKHDDVVDSLAWCMRLILNHHAPKPRKKKDAEQSWLKKLMSKNRRGDSHMAA